MTTGLTPEQFEAERALEREARIELLKAYRRKITAAMKRLSVGKAKWFEVTSAIKMVTDQLRAEYRASGQVEPSEPLSHETPAEPTTEADPLSELTLFNESA